MVELRPQTLPFFPLYLSPSRSCIPSLLDLVESDRKKSWSKRSVTRPVSPVTFDLLWRTLRRLTFHDLSKDAKVWCDYYA